MNDLTRYKVKNFLVNMLNKIILIPFMPAKILYAKNGTFKNWVDKKNHQSYKKQAYKREISEIAFYINQNEDNSCSVFFGYDYDRNIPTDIIFRPTSVLLENNSWIKKNKLTVEWHTLESYCDTYFKDQDLINRYYVFSSKKESTVLIIRKP